MTVESITYEPFREPGAPNKHELRILQAAVTLTGELGEPPHLSRLARDLGYTTRQGVHHWVKSMRKKGLLEDSPGPGSKQGIVLTHNGLLAVATAMGADT